MPGSFWRCLPRPKAGVSFEPFTMQPRLTIFGTAIAGGFHHRG